jgi:hypothetical protein
MNTTNKIAVMLVTALFSSSLMAAESGCEKPGAPQEITAKVVKVDMDKHQLTLQDSNGTTHVMNANDETLKRYKPGDSLTAKLRCPDK